MPIVHSSLRRGNFIFIRKNTVENFTSVIKMLNMVKFVFTDLFIECMKPLFTLNMINFCFL